MQAIKQVVVVDQDAMRPSQLSEQVSFWNPDGTSYEGLPSDAGDISYDNDDSGLTADDVQAAIDEIVADQAVINATIGVHTSVTTATAIGTAAKTTVSALPANNTFVLVKFTNGNSAASPTLAFATGGAKTILLGGTAPSGAEATFAADGVGMFWFDGTSLHQIGLYS